MIEEYSKVRIKANGVTGQVIDVSKVGQEYRYIVESDEKNVPGGWWEASPDAWSLFTCTESEIEKIED